MPNRWRHRKQMRETHSQWMSTFLWCILQAPCRFCGGAPLKVGQVENQKECARLLACRLGWSFCPFILEATGVWGGKSKPLTHWISQKYALRHGCSAKEAGIVCRTRLQLSVVGSLAQASHLAPGATRLTAMTCFGSNY